MKFRLLLIALVATITACSSQQASHRAKDKECTVCTDDTKREMTAEQKEMMKKFEAYATPGPEHKLLARRAGNWNCTVKMWESPDAPPTESAGTCESTLILGGRFLHEHFTGSFNGQPFEGMGVTGYDNIKKKYVGGWIDSMGTGIMTSEGSASADGRTFTSDSEFSCPITNATRHSRMVDKMIDDDHFVMEMFDTAPDGKEMKMMQIDYTRRK